METQIEVHMEDPKDYVTQEEIIKELGISEKSCWALISNEFFPSIKLSKKLIIVPKKAYRQFISDPENLIKYTQRNNKKATNVSPSANLENIDGSNDMLR